MSAGRPIRLVVGAALCVLPALVPGAAAQRISFEAEAATPDLVSVVVTGLDVDIDLPSEPGEAGEPGTWAEILRVVAIDPDATAGGSVATDLPALLGRYAFDGRRLRFTPRFPPSPGLELVATFDGAAWDVWTGGRETTSATSSFRVPTLERPPSTRVASVSPPGPIIPSNLLRFYVHFDAPMSARGVLDAISLEDATGKRLSDAFVDLPDGLWDDQRRRLTLIVHPGRVKRGVRPHEALGPVLAEGDTVVLRIGADALDANSRPLVEPAAIRYQVGPADRESPDPALWRVILPGERTGALRLDLDQAVDSALLQRMLTVHDQTGRALDGVVAVSADATAWSFRPRLPWTPGHYQIHVPAALEDLAGNRLDRPFEASSRPQTSAQAPDTVIPVEIY